MGPVWIVLADTHHARIYAQRQRGAPLTLVEEVSHPGAAKLSRELGTDRPGRRREQTQFGAPRPTPQGATNNPSFHAKPGGTVPHTEPDEVEDRRFAHLLARRIEEGRVKGAFQELVLFMNPRALGMVRNELDKPTKSCVVHTVDGDFMHLQKDDLAKRLADHWFVPQQTFAP